MTNFLENLVKKFKDHQMTNREQEDSTNDDIKRKIQRWEFTDDEKTLKCKHNPLVINVHKGESSIVFENEELNIVAVGSTPKETMDNFSETLIFFYEHYKDIPENKDTEKEVKRVFTKSAEEIKKLFNEKFYLENEEKNDE